MSHYLKMPYLCLAISLSCNKNSFYFLFTGSSSWSNSNAKSYAFSCNVYLKVFLKLNCWNAFLDILEIFSYNLHKKAVAIILACLCFHWQRDLQHFCSGMHRNQNLKFLDGKVTYILKLFSSFNTFCLSIFSFCYLFAKVINLN